MLTSLQDGLKELATNDNTASLNPDSMNGYSNAMSLIKSILNCSVSLGMVPSSSKYANSISTPTDVAVNVMGSCNFFAHQFKHHVANVVRESELSSGNNSNESGGEGLIPSARDLRTFTSIAAGSELVNARGGVWPQLYYALRCGDALAAESIVKQYYTPGMDGDESLSGVEQAVMDTVTHLVQLQQDRETIFGDSTNGNTRPPQVLEDSLRANSRCADASPS